MQRTKPSILVGRTDAEWKSRLFIGRGESESVHGGGHPSGKGKLSAQSILLLTVNAMFAAANALSGTFVNVYLWKVKQDFAMIGWFAVSHQVTMAVTFWLAGKWVKEHNKMLALRLGVGIAAVFYLMILMLRQSAVHYVTVLGSVQGISSGLFWLAFNVVYFEVTDPDNRDRFNGWAGLLGSAAGMLAPWISGLLITSMSNSRGYTLIFALSLGIFLAGVIVSFFLKKRKVSGHYGWFYPFKQLGTAGSPWRFIVPALVAQGVREGVFGFVIGLLVFIATTNEAKLGDFALFTSAVAFVSFWIIGKFMKPKIRVPAMLVGILFMISVILPFFWKVNFATLLIFGIGTALFIPLYTIPMTSWVFDVIGKDSESASRREEYVVLRELSLNVGRMAGTLIFIIIVSFTTQPLPINLMLLGIGSAPFFCWFFMRRLAQKN